MPSEPRSDSVAPAAAAPARLVKARRWAVAGRVGVWGALAAGPIALLMSCGSSPDAVQASASPAPVVTAPQADPSGYAEEFLALWLESSSDDTTTAQSRAAQAMAPDVDLPEPSDTAAAQSRLVRVAAVRSAQLADGGWSVTVAAQFTDGVRYFTVPLVLRPGSGALAVTAAPAAVSAPGRARVSDSPYGTAVAADAPLASTVGEFLTAYLTHVGEVDRYLAPGESLAVAAGSRFERVEVLEVRADSEQAAGAVPADGTTVRVFARTTATDADGAWPLDYALRLSARAGRWEIAAVEPGPQQRQLASATSPSAPSAAPRSSSTSAPSTGGR